MNDELRAIRAQEAIADEVYDSSDADASEDFVHALLALAPKETQRCVNCGVPHSRRNVRHNSMSAFCTDVCHDAAMQ
jgi:hypothetical protein